MKVIHKKIFLEPYKSKINGSLTSYDEYGVEQPFTVYKNPDYTNKNFVHEIYNYGMFPLDVVYNGNVLSYSTLIERYYFCKKYIDMLKYKSICGEDEYNDAIEFYEKTFGYHTDEERKIYENLKSKFEEYGGESFFNWCDNILYGGNAEQSIYFYACQEIKDGDNEERCENYQLIAKEGEYICPKCGKKLSLVKGVYNDEFIYSFHINIPILFTNTIDEMGEFSIFCEEWEPGIDFLSEQYRSGATIVYEENVYKLNGNGSGTTYDEQYKELLFEPNHWDILNVNNNSVNDEVHGVTESKLSSLKTYGSSFDDMGNELPGMLQKSGDMYIQPTEGSYLDLLYKVGNTSELTPFYDENDNLQYYFGNKIEKISLYYVDYYGNKIEEVPDTNVSKDDNIKERIDICKDNIDKFKTKYKNSNYIIDNHYSIQDDVRCEITYVMGAILDENKNIKSNCSGVVYTEEVILKDKTCEYMLDEVSSFIVHYYEIEYNVEYDNLKEYSNAIVKTNKSKFHYEIKNDTTDDLISAPILREEYKFGSSSLENIESDIYIDRGFSASFEQHLKLLDVNSMQALENYGNGFFNIIES